MSQSATGQPASVSDHLATLVGTVGGLLIARYVGWAMVLIPLAFIGLFGWLGRKWLRPAAQPLLEAFAVQAGLLGWMLVGTAVLIAGAVDSAALTQQLPSLIETGLDVVWLLGGLVWLVIRPGTGAVLCLGLYQVLKLAGNLFSLSEAALNTVEHKALIVHLLLAVLALVFLVQGWLRLWRLRAAEAATMAGG